MKNTIFFPGVFLVIFGLQNCTDSSDPINFSKNRDSKSESHYLNPGADPDSVIYLFYKNNNNNSQEQAISQMLFYHFLKTNIQHPPREETKKEVYVYKGTYSFGNKKYIGVVDFNGVENSDNLSFIISIGSSKGCTSSLKGTAKITKPGLATYKDSISGCSLDFMFNNNKLEVKENKCRLFHGASCQFHGTFNKE